MRHLNQCVRVCMYVCLLYVCTCVHERMYLGIFMSSLHHPIVTSVFEYCSNILRELFRLLFRGYLSIIRAHYSSIISIGDDARCPTCSPCTYLYRGFVSPRVRPAACLWNMSSGGKETPPGVDSADCVSASDV